MSLGQDNAGAGPNRGNTGLYVVPHDLRFLPFNDADRETGDTITPGLCRSAVAGLDQTSPALGRLADL